MLPIRPKRADKSKAATEEEKLSAAESVQSVLELVLQELPALWEKGIEILCPDGKVRIGHPVIASWSADYPEYIKLFTASYMSCPICTVPRTGLDAHPTEPPVYKTLSPDDIREKVLEKQRLETMREGLKKKSDEYADISVKIKAIDDFFAAQRISPIDNILLRAPHASPQTLWKPDLLHTMYLGLTKSLLELLFNLLDEVSKKSKKDYRPLNDLFDIIWMAVSPHPAISVPKKKYRSVKQWSGKEYRNAQAILLAVLEAVMLTYPAQTEADEARFEGARNLIAALSNFTLMARQKSHTLPPDVVFDDDYRRLWDGERAPDPHSSISYMQTYLAQFHKWKHVFLKYRASKTVKKDAKEYAKGKYPDLSDADVKRLEEKPSELLKKKADIAAKQRAAKEEYLERHSHFNMPKVHMMTHFAEVIHLFGSLPQYSTSINELLHQPLNNAYDRSNKVDAMDQTLRFAGWKDAMAIKTISLLYHCKKGRLPESVIADIKMWLDIFENRKAKLEAARKNRDRMMPRKSASERKAEKAANAAEHKELLRKLQRELGISEAEDEDSDNSEDEERDVSADIMGLTAVPPSAAERDAAERQKDPGRLLRGRILSITNEEGMTRSFMCVRDIQEYFRLNGLVAALTDCLRKEKIHGSISNTLVPSLEASPYYALRIRRPVFQVDDLENHIIRCTAGENFRNSLPREDFIVYKPLEGIHHPVMGDRSIARLWCLFRVRFPGTDGRKATYARFAAIRPMVQCPMTPSEVARAMPVFEFDTQKELAVIRIGAIERAACVVPLWNRKYLPPSSPKYLWKMATRVVFNSKVDLETFHAHY